jgi:DNA polymerase-3 subunit gamma/tau
MATAPVALARQLVRYLRNCLMSKLGGENTQLLEIAQDERARAYRTAQLFSEEDLTRNLQIALRTFDELNYRQEQRFHLELGMLKLIQAQRLLPMEEILSGLASQSGPKRTYTNRTGICATSRSARAKAGGTGSAIAFALRCQQSTRRRSPRSRIPTRNTPIASVEREIAPQAISNRPRQLATHPNLPPSALWRSLTRSKSRSPRRTQGRVGTANRTPTTPNSA